MKNLKDVRNAGRVKNAKDVLPHSHKQSRPWGGFMCFILNHYGLTLKLITLKAGPGHAISLQTHQRRDEYWYVISGSGVIHIGGKNHKAKVGDMFFTPRLTRHRITSGPQGLECLEIAFGEFDEEDIERHEDLYNRI